MVATKGTRILTRPGHPDFLDLPWDRRLEDWKGDQIVEVARGVHRHVVRFLDVDGALYALKEMPSRLVRREYGMLRRMSEEGLPVVELVGAVNRTAVDVADGPLEDVLLTRYLDYSLPYRTLFQHRRQRIVVDNPDDIRGLHERLLDALAMLLVRMHLNGFYWGDCSLSNTLFRRDAGALAVYIVDLETGEYHQQLTPGQRAADLEVTELNVAGGLMDLQAEFGLPPHPDPVDTAADLVRRYERLWEELNEEVIVGPDERYRIEARVRRLNELGFDVDEVELVASDGGDELRLRTSVTEQGHHRRRLESLTGLEAQENQARSLLNDLANFRAARERRLGRSLPDAVAAYQWLSEIFEPVAEAIPEELRGKLEPVEVFHEIIEHKWFLSEQAGMDVGMEEAMKSYLGTVLPDIPDERAVVGEPEATDGEEGWIGFG